jgi:hypothetical protein
MEAARQARVAHLDIDLPARLPRPAPPEDDPRAAIDALDAPELWVSSCRADAWLRTRTA